MKNNEVYRYKDKYYLKLDEIQVKNEKTREWDVYILYSDPVGNIYAREIKEFYQRFTLHASTPNFPELWNEIKQPLQRWLK